VRSRRAQVLSCIVLLVAACQSKGTRIPEEHKLTLRVDVTTPDGQEVAGAALEVGSQRHFADEHGVVVLALSRTARNSEEPFINVSCPIGYFSDDKQRHLAGLGLSNERPTNFHMRFVCKPEKVKLGLALFVETGDDVKAWLSGRFLGQTRSGVLHVIVNAFPGERLLLDVEPVGHLLRIGAPHRSVLVADRDMLVVHAVKAERHAKDRLRLARKPPRVPEPILPQRL